MAIEASCVILTGGGRSDRFGASTPRVLQEVCGIPVLGHVMKTVEEVGAAPLALVAEDGAIEKFVGSRGVVISQGEKKGSAAALISAIPFIKEAGKDVFVVYGDRLYLSANTLDNLAATCAEAGADAVISSVVFDKPHGNGRVVRKPDGSVLRAVTDCTLRNAAEIDIREVVTGAYYFRREALLSVLEEIAAEGAAENLMTEVVTKLAERGKVLALKVEDQREALGVYSFRDLAEAHAWVQTRLLEYWMAEGVRIVDPRTTVIDADALIGEGTVIFPNTIIEGPSEIGRGCRVGPFARIRAGVVLGDEVCLDDFVDIAAADSDAQPLARS